MVLRELLRGGMRRGEWPMRSRNVGLLGSARKVRSFTRIVVEVSFRVVNFAPPPQGSGCRGSFRVTTARNIVKYFRAIHKPSLALLKELNYSSVCDKKIPSVMSVFSCVVSFD